MARRWGDVIRGYVRRRVPLLLCLVIVFGAGATTGALAVDLVAADGRAALAEEVDALIRIAGSRPAAPAADIVRFALVEYVAKVAGVIGLLGLSMVGAPMVLVVVFLRGFVLGFTALFLMDGRWLPGIALALAGLLPHNLLAVPATLAAGVGALSFSGAAWRALLGRRDVNMYHQLAGSLLVLCASAAALVAAALVEAYVSPVLMSTASRLLLTR